jgi:4-amino-4-deoxy-L-arabinose transferase-like glycosyltransferase
VRIGRAVAGLLAVAVIARVAAGLALNVDGTTVRGFQFYGEMARSLLDGDGMRWRFYESLGFKYANRSPLYPLLLAGLWWGGAGAVVTVVTQAVVGALGCLIPAAIARRWGGERAFLLTLGLAAVWPYWVLIDTAMVEHVLYTPFVLAAAWLVMRVRDDTDGVGRGIAAGCLMGVAALARVTFGLCMPLLALSVFVRRRGFRSALILTVAASAALAPWVIRNHAVVGAVTVGTDGGRALWASNAPGTFEHYPERSIDDSEDFLYRVMDREDPGRLSALRALSGDEVAQNRMFLELAIVNLRAHPGQVAWGFLRKAAALWSPVYNPSPPDPGHGFLFKSLLHGATLTAMIIATLAGLLNVPRLRADLPVVLAVLAGFTLAAMLFWGQPRYLAPLHGFALAAAASWWCARVRVRHAGATS